MKTSIKQLSTSTGSLENSPLEFSEGLNCIIGSRGTCKSTIVETIRFLFNCDEEQVEALIEEPDSSASQKGSPSPRGLIRASLRDGTAKCLILNASEGDHNEELLVERSVGSAPRVYREGVQEVEAHKVLARIEIYSQGQLERIAGDSALRLQLIDRPNQEQVEELRKERAEISAELRDLGPRIRRQRNEIDAHRAETRSLEAYRRDLESLHLNRPQLSPGLSAEREAYQRRNDIIETLQKLGRERQAALSSIMDVTREHTKFMEAAQQLSSIEHPEAKTLQERLSVLAGFLERTRAEATVVIEEPMGPNIDLLRSRFDKENEAYFALRRGEQEVSDSLRKEDALRQQIDKMEAIEKRVSSLAEQLSQLLERRKELRSRLEHISDQLYQFRLREVEKINSDFGDVVLLSLRQGFESIDYKNLVNSLLQGSRIRHQEEVAADISKRVLPSDLIDVVESGDAKRLAESLERDIGQMTRLVSHLLDNPRLYDLEYLVFEDWLEITMYISAEPKPISQLSRGQMATALLPLILRSATYPLIFDQPEDDLDNAFVFKTLISRIRDLKAERQLIFVTHNANIPVLGDADKVIVMSMKNPQKADIPFVGSVDESREHILSLLEGGAEAFRRRQEKYSELLK